MNKLNQILTYRFHLLFYLIFIFVALSFPSYSQAQGVFHCQCFTGQGQTCTTWSILSKCDAGYSPEQSQCNTACDQQDSCKNADYLSNDKRVTNLTCKQVSSISAKWGGACTTQTICIGSDKPLACRDGQCLVGANSLSDGAVCKENSECGVNSICTNGTCKGKSICNQAGTCNGCSDGSQQCAEGFECVQNACVNMVNLTSGICNQIGQLDDKLRQDCEACSGTALRPTGKMWTSIGCIPVTTNGIITSLIKIIVSIAGGAALIFILLGAFTISTSTSNPERLKSGQEMVTSAIIGLVFILFSIIILHFLGVELFQIPGLPK
jgi:hypothetical protein